MQDGYGNIKAAGAVELVAISSDTQFGTANTQRGRNITYKLLSDEDTIVISAYNVNEQHQNPNHARPSAFIINENGKIVWKDLGGRFGHRTTSSQIITGLNEL